MEDWFGVAPLDDFKAGARQVVDVDGVSVLVVNNDGDICAVENLCTHQSLPMQDGTIVDGHIVCPFHGAQYCLKTGQVKTAPAYEDLPVFPVKVENGIVFVRDGRWD